MHEELNTLHKSVNLLKAQLSYLREGAQRAESALEDICTDLDAFVEIYTLDQKK